MSTEANPETSTSNRLKLVAQGRALPRTDAERAADAERLRAALKRMAEIPDDDPPGTDEAFMRAIDEGRPHRPLFDGMY